MDDGGLLRRVSPFRYLRINGYLLLPEAFRSLSRLSSALSAKASTLRSSSLDLPHIYSVIYERFRFLALDKHSCIYKFCNLRYVDSLPVMITSSDVYLFRYFDVFPYAIFKVRIDVSTSEKYTAWKACFPKHVFFSMYWRVTP